MTPTPVLVGAGAAVGASVRYGVGRRLDGERLPTATLVVNVAGSFLLGVVVAAGPGTEAALALGTGFCGSLTTYSSFAVDTVDLWQQDDSLAAAGYAVVTLVACLAAGAVGGALVAVA